MRIKKYILATLVTMLLCGCSDFTDIYPKGKNILNRVEDLDLVLNSRYTVNCSNVTYLVNDCFPQWVNVPDLLTQEIKSLDGVLLTWDEKTYRAALTNSDTKYSSLYSLIATVANAVLLNIDAATGDRVKADQLKAEALVLRAWCHYILVNLYAKAYDPATAASTAGIVYALETDNISSIAKKKTVAQVYDAIMKDLETAFSLKSLPENPASMRIGLSFAYAVKAKVLMSMRDYEGAFDAAKESLNLKNTIDDYNEKLVTSETAKKKYGVTVDELKRDYLTYDEELWETPSRWALPFTYEFWNELEEYHIFHTGLLPDTYLATLSSSVQADQAMKYNGLENLPYPTVTNVYYSPMGLTTVDMYLTQAECYLRDGDVNAAMKIINQIRAKRVLTNHYSELSASTSQEAFAWLKKVSRAENFYTFKTFINLKRWNTEEEYAETLHRKIPCTNVTEWDAKGNPTKTETVIYEYELRPDSPLWIFPFPQDATDLNPNLTQNFD